MEFLNSQVFQIDFSQSEDSKIATPTNLTDNVKNFLIDIVSEVSLEENDSKSFKFASNDVELATTTLDIYYTKDKIEDGNSIFNANVQKIINRFIRIEKRVDEREALYELKNCSFIVSYLKFANQFILFLGKFEPGEYYEDASFKKTTGFSTKKNQRYYKMTMISFNEDNDNIEMQISVLETSLSKYWAADFLEAEELTNDEINTSRSFKYIDNVLSKNFKKAYPQDYREMRNTLISEFRNNDEFKLNAFMDKIFSLKDPTCDPEKISEVKTRTITKFNEKNYDKSFRIVQGVIKKRMSRKYIINDDVTLTNHTGLTNSITLKKNNNGDDVIEILVTNAQTIASFGK